MPNREPARAQAARSMDMQVVLSMLSIAGAVVGVLFYIIASASKRRSRV